MSALSSKQERPVLCITIAGTVPQLLHLSLSPSSALVWDSAQAKFYLLVLSIFKPWCGLSSHPQWLFLHGTFLLEAESLWWFQICPNNKRQPAWGHRQTLHLRIATHKADILNITLGEGVKVQLVLLIVQWSCWDPDPSEQWRRKVFDLLQSWLCPGEGRVGMRRWEEMGEGGEWGFDVGSVDQTWNKEQDQGCW